VPAPAAKAPPARAARRTAPDPTSAIDSEADDDDLDFGVDDVAVPEVSKPDQPRSASESGGDDAVVTPPGETAGSFQDGELDDFGQSQPAPRRVGPRLWQAEAPIECNQRGCGKRFWPTHPRNAYCPVCRTIPSAKRDPLHAIGGRAAPKSVAPRERPEMPAAPPEPPPRRAYTTGLVCDRCECEIASDETVDVASGKVRHMRDRDCAAAKRRAREAEAVAPDPSPDEPVETPLAEGNGGVRVDDPVTPKVAAAVEQLLADRQEMGDELTALRDRVTSLEREVEELHDAIDGPVIDLLDITLGRAMVALAKIGRGDADPAALLELLGKGRKDQE
jgi:hypothetical protein